MSFERQAAGGATPATVVPLADGVGDARTGAVGVATRLAREDHIHPIARITNPANPTPSVGGGNVAVVSQSGSWVSTTEETAVYMHTWNVTITGAAGWKSFSLSTPVGYVAHNHYATAYQSSGTGSPNGVALWIGDALNAWLRKTGATSKNYTITMFKEYRVA